MDSILNNYFKARQELFDYFGYDGPTWIGISDDTSYYWCFDPDEENVYLSPHEEELIKGLPSYSIETIYKPAGADTAIYVGAAHTMVCLTDSGDTYLRLFDNLKQVDFYDCDFS